MERIIMSRHWRGPYLYLKPADRESDKKATWVIRDRGQIIYTHAKADERSKANKVFQRYLSQTHPDGLPVMPEGLPVVRVFKPRPMNQGIYFVSCEVDGFPIKIGWA